MKSESHTDRSDLEQQILRVVLSPDYKPVKPKGIAKKLGLVEDKVMVRKAIKRLVRAQKLGYGSNHLVTPVESRDENRMTGIFRRTRNGSGYVRLPPRPSGEILPDIHIDARYATDASSGDTVLIRLLQKSRRGTDSLEGEVLEIVERDTHQFVGTYFEEAGMGFAQINGTLFSKPISLGDPGAKGPSTDDKVVIEMVRFPSHFHSGEGVILRVLGPRGAPGVYTQSIIHEYDLPGEFAQDALEEARNQAEKFDESIGIDRLDLTEVTIITIDPATARDFDDAISLRGLENGHWQLGVHIADVSHFVPPGSALDREAQDRSTSTYLPDMVIPMLPEIISNNLASLQPGHVRYTMSVFIEFTDEGTFIAADAHSAAIKSCRRFNYEEVDQYLDDPEPWREKLSGEVHSLLKNMHTLAMTLRHRRLERGSLELTMNDVEIDLDHYGRVTGAHFEENTESHQMIEEFMLAANEAVARTLSEKGIDFPHRVHPLPDPRKLKLLTEFVNELGLETGSLENRFALQQLLNRVKGRPEQHAVNFAVLRAMSRAVYSPEDAGHYALASDCYCHFTSPIRRYPDLILHRQLFSLLTSKPPRYHFNDLVTLSQHCSERERRAEAAERDLIKIKLLHYLASRIGEEFEAIITGVESFGLFAQGTYLPAEGMVHISSLGDDFYTFERDSHSLTGRRTGNTYRLGDVIHVVVARVDEDQRQLDFRIVKGERKDSPNRTHTNKPTQKRHPKKGFRKKKPAKAKSKKSGKKRPKSGHRRKRR